MRHIAAVLVDRANYGRLKPVLEALKARHRIGLTVIAGGSMVLERFNRPVEQSMIDGFPAIEVFHEVEGSTPETMAQSIGLGIIHYAAALRRLRPDVVLLIGDRYQALAAAIAAATLNLTIVHVQGGEISGSIDESYRHAITKLSHYHAPATELAAANLLAMGERRNSILTVGCPSSDLARRLIERGYREHETVVAAYHPQTTRYGAASREVHQLLQALAEISRPTLMLWPNIDADADRIHKEIRRFRDRYSHLCDWLKLRRTMSPEEYLELLAGAPLCVGNSSSFVRDAGYFGTPVVLVGGRQDGRECGQHVKRADTFAADIVEKIRTQLEHGRYQPSQLYGDGFVSGPLAAQIEQIKLYSQKQLNYAKAA